MIGQTKFFQLKLKKLMEFLKNGTFGEPQAWLYSIEFQKRGFPHVHIHLWLKSAFKIQPDAIDKVIVAEIPLMKQIQHCIYTIVKANMVHGPCGMYFNHHSVCMTNGTCSKKYPRELIPHTQQGVDGYSKY